MPFFYIHLFLAVLNRSTPLMIKNLVDRVEHCNLYEIYKVPICAYVLSEYNIKSVAVICS